MAKEEKKKKKVIDASQPGENLKFSGSIITRKDGTKEKNTIDVQKRGRTEVARAGEGRLSAREEAARQQELGGTTPETNTTTNKTGSSKSSPSPDNNQPLNLPSEEFFRQEAERQNPSMSEQVSQQFAPENQNVGLEEGYRGRILDKTGENIAVTTKATIRGAFSVYDNLKSLVHGDTVDVKDARNLMTNGKTALNAVIGDINAGIPAEESEVIALFDIAYGANAVLQRNFKERGINNFAYWIKDGRNLEEETYLNQLELTRLRREMFIALENAKNQKEANRVNEINQKYGVA